MEIWRKYVARFYYARGAEHRPNTEFMLGVLSFRLLTFLNPHTLNGTRATNFETVGCIRATFGKICVHMCVCRLIELQMDDNR